MFARLLPLTLACAALRGQTFEAASVKPATPLGPAGFLSDQKGGPGTSDPGTFTCRNCTLYWVLADAYNIHDYDFSGPDWLKSTRFDFAAKIPTGSAAADFPLMLRNLLAERFKLVTHTETRQVQLYEMTVGKTGPKFKESTPKDPGPDTAPTGPMKRDGDGFPILAPGVSMAMIPGHARIQSNGQPLSWFAEMLSGQVRAPVIDATGLTGKYDFIVSWSWEEGPDAASAAAADLIYSVQPQLGLKLERKKGPWEVIVVDHMEKTPTAN